jgi:NAD(P)-dependent dehydrogenase (short-subunit alcohol dehydrogenase family)
VLLQDRTAIVHGASGSIGSAIARAFAREGAVLHLTGRTLSTLEEVAAGIRNHGGEARVAELDALDRDAVERHAAQAAEQDGGIDICFNATNNDDIQGTPLLEMRVEDVVQPVAKAVTSTFTVATAPPATWTGAASSWPWEADAKRSPTSAAPMSPGRARRPVPADGRGARPRASASRGCSHRAPPIPVRPTQRPTA